MLTIVALGDSTTAGTPGFRSPLEAPPDGAGNEESQYGYWLMKLHPHWRVLNRGVNGERSDEIRTRFARDVLDERARIESGLLLAIVIAGVNDIYQGRSAASVQRELEAMYIAAHEAGVPIAAGSIVPYNTATADQNARMRAVNAWIRDYASGRDDMAFCDTRASVAASDDPDRLASSPDGLHPSREGYRLMALAIEPAVAALARRMPRP